MNKRKRSKLGIVIIIGLFVYFSYVAVAQQKLLYEKNLDMKTIQDKIAAESKLNEQLKKKKETVNSDEYIEKVAREKLDMVKHGEKVFVDINK